MAPWSFFKLLRRICCCSTTNSVEAIQTAPDIPADDSPTPLVPDQEDDFIPPPSPIPPASTETLHSILLTRTYPIPKSRSEGDAAKHVKFADLERRRKRIGWRVIQSGNPEAGASDNEPSEDDDHN